MFFFWEKSYVGFLGFWNRKGGKLGSFGRNKGEK